MANEQNLIPMNKRSQRERREIAQKGARASNESQRKKKSLKEKMILLLELPITDVKDYNKIAKAGIPLDDIDNAQLIVLGLFKRAKAGDVYAFKEIRDLIGDAVDEAGVQIIDDY